MKTIYKYKTDVGITSLMLPQGAQILSVALQHEVPHVWALVETDNEKVIRKLIWLGTGHPARGAEDGRFVGTVVMDGGSLVFHLFEAA